ncbi:response regulator [Meiothermus sp.]|uniref:response regulator n=1 Tax=Meiothermus sp. TaxID=1955249 RepID=UPI00307F9B53
MIRARLGEIELGDLLRTLEGGRKNAVISISCPKLKGRIHIREGKIAYIQTHPGPHLGEYLVRFDYLTLEQVQELVKYQQQENPGTPLGFLALQQKMVTEGELNDVLHAQILEALATILGQQEGELVAETPPIDASQVLLPGVTDTSAILIEALRRLDEWMRGKVDPGIVLQLAGDPTRHALSPDAWTVLEAIDGVKRARSVALECDLPEEQVYHLLYELKSRGLLMEADVRPQDPLLMVLSDSNLIRRLLLVTLERHRYRVMLPPDLESAKRILEHNRVQGILLEGTDLPDKVRQLRSLPSGRFLPIWLITEQTPRGLWVRNARVNHIHKPFGEEDLLEALSIIKRIL